MSSAEWAIEETVKFFENFVCQAALKYSDATELDSAISTLNPLHAVLTDSNSGGHYKVELSPYIVDGDLEFDFLVVYEEPGLSPKNITDEILDIIGEMMNHLG